MNELISELPKGHFLRNAVARQLKDARSLERKKHHHITNRDGEDYVGVLLGLKHFFNYVKHLETSNLVLDIGAGELWGVRELSGSSFGEGIRFETTILRPKTINHLGKDDVIHAVPVETLNGISDESVGGVMGVYSVAYSDAPAFAIRSIDRVLVPGGVIKATFMPKLGPYYKRVGQLKKYTEFKNELQKLNYDLATYDKYTFIENHSLLLAIKPGGKNQITAKELLKIDRESVGRQLKLLRREKWLK